jgi:hypothetical protein
MIDPYKERAVDLNRPVEMYRCLNRSGFTFSIRQFGRVVGHTSDIVLKDCVFRVSNGGKKRCIEEKTRNVHAYIKGTVGSKEDIFMTASFKLNYDPYSELGFNSYLLGEVESAMVVYTENNKIMFQI